MGIADNIWWTRKARIQAEKRLLSNAFQSQLLLLWYSFLSAAVSIYYLEVDTTVDKANIAGVIWIVFSVLILCMSGFITGLSFKERAALIKESYEALNNLYHQAKTKGKDIESVSKDYQQIMGLCENHKDCDYYLALCLEYVTSAQSAGGETGLKEGPDRSPTWYHWFSLTWWTLKRFLMLAFLYALPVFLLFSLEFLV